MPPLIPVAILGFDTPSRLALAASLVSTARRQPGYKPMLGVDDAQVVVVNADNPESLALLNTLGRSADAVMVSVTPPAPGARPPGVDPALVLQRLDAKMRETAAAAAEASRGASTGSAAGLPTDPGAPAPTATAPASAGPNRSQQQRELRRQRKFGQPVWAPPRALAVDDSDIALHFLRRKLLPYGIDCDFARDSDRALDLLAQHAYPLVFLDLDLGEDSRLDGFALCHQIHQRWRHEGKPVPVVVIVSAFNDPVHHVRGTLAGARAFLRKPLNDEALCAVLQKLVALPASQAPV